MIDTTDKTLSAKDGPWDLPGWAFWLLAAGLPLGMLAIHFDLGHQGDIRFFFDWYRSFKQPLDVYSSGIGINYPFLGVLWVCGPARILEVITGQELSFETYRWVLKITLCLAEIAVFPVLSGIARTLGLARPRILASCIYLLPATWAGGALFGQIDVIGNLLLLLAAFGLLKFSLSDLQSRSSVAWLCIGTATATAAFMTKQLTWFSMPGLMCLAIFGLARLWRTVSRGRAAAVTGLALLPTISVFLPDLFLNLPEGYSSHLMFIVLGGGSAHIDDMSGSGANMWSLIFPKPSGSALRVVFLGLTAKTWGLLLFTLVQLLLLGWLGVRGRNLWSDDSPARERSRMFSGHLLLFIGLSNLAMVVLLTGVHERYLYHGVPFLLLGVSHFRVLEPRRGLRLAIGTWFVCAWSGMFVLSSIYWHEFSGILVPFRIHQTLANWQIALLLASLVFLALSLYRPMKNSD